MAVRPYGKYTLEDLAPANYTVKFNDYTSGGYGAWYGCDTQATAKALAIKAGQAISGIESLEYVFRGQSVPYIILAPFRSAMGRAEVTLW